jgi:ABC-type sugar transport system substrate-binding protein
MKLAKVFLPVMALMALPLGAIPARADQKVKIGVTMASFGHTFHISMMDGMKKWAEAHPDVELSMVDARDDSAKQTGQVENFLAQGMDAIIVQPVGASATGSMSKMAIKAGKPLVYINRKPEKLPQGVLYCGGKLGKICVGGVDATRDALESMDKGELNNTVFQDGAGQGAEAVNAAYLAVKKQPNPKVVDGSILIPYQPVTKENYKQFLK